MAKNKNLKRKPTPFTKAKQKETKDDESASEPEVNGVVRLHFPSTFLSGFLDFVSRN